MIDPKRATEDLSAVEVVDGENGRSLVGIHEPSEAARLARVWVARHVDVDYLAIPGSRIWSGLWLLAIVGAVDDGTH